MPLRMTSATFFYDGRQASNDALPNLTLFWYPGSSRLHAFPTPNPLNLSHYLKENELLSANTTKKVVSCEREDDRKAWDKT